MIVGDNCVVSLSDCVSLDMCLLLCFGGFVTMRPVGSCVQIIGRVLISCATTSRLKNAWILGFLFSDFF